MLTRFCARRNLAARDDNPDFAALSSQLLLGGPPPRGCGARAREGRPFYSTTVTERRFAGCPCSFGMSSIYAPEPASAWKPRSARNSPARGPRLSMSRSRGEKGYLEALRLVAFPRQRHRRRSATTLLGPLCLGRFEKASRRHARPGARRCAGNVDPRALERKEPGISRTIGVEPDLLRLQQVPIFSSSTLRASAIGFSLALQAVIA